MSFQSNYCTKVMTPLCCRFSAVLCVLMTLLCFPFNNAIASEYVWISAKCTSASGNVYYPAYNSSIFDSDNYNYNSTSGENSDFSFGSYTAYHQKGSDNKTYNGTMPATYTHGGITYNFVRWDKYVNGVLSQENCGIPVNHNHDYLQNKGCRQKPYTLTCNDGVHYMAIYQEQQNPQYVWLSMRIGDHNSSNKQTIAYNSSIYNFGSGVSYSSGHDISGTNPGYRFVSTNGCNISAPSPITYNGHTYTFSGWEEYDYDNYHSNGSSTPNCVNTSDPGQNMGYHYVAVYQEQQQNYQHQYIWVNVRILENGVLTDEKISRSSEDDFYANNFDCFTYTNINNISYGKYETNKEYQYYNFKCDDISQTFSIKNQLVTSSKGKNYRFVRYDQYQNGTYTQNITPQPLKTVNALSNNECSLGTNPVTILVYEEVTQSSQQHVWLGMFIKERGSNTITAEVPYSSSTYNFGSGVQYQSGLQQLTQYLNDHLGEITAYHFTTSNCSGITAPSTITYNNQTYNFVKWKKIDYQNDRGEVAPECSTDQYPGGVYYQALYEEPAPNYQYYWLSVRIIDENGNYTGTNHSISSRDLYDNIGSDFNYTSSCENGTYSSTYANGYHTYTYRSHSITATPTVQNNFVTASNKRYEFVRFDQYKNGAYHQNVTPEPYYAVNTITDCAYNNNTSAPVTILVYREVPNYQYQYYWISTRLLDDNGDLSSTDYPITTTNQNLFDNFGNFNWTSSCLNSTYTSTYNSNQFHTYTYRSNDITASPVIQNNRITVDGTSYEFVRFDQYKNGSYSQNVTPEPILVESTITDCTYDDNDTVPVTILVYQEVPNYQYIWLNVRLADQNGNLTSDHLNASDYPEFYDENITNCFVGNTECSSHRNATYDGHQWTVYRCTDLSQNFSVKNTIVSRNGEVYEFLRYDQYRNGSYTQNITPSTRKTVNALSDCAISNDPVTILVYRKIEANHQYAWVSFRLLESNGNLNDPAGTNLSRSNYPDFYDKNIECFSYQNTTGSNDTYHSNAKYYVYRCDDMSQTYHVKNQIIEKDGKYYAFVRYDQYKNGTYTQNTTPYIKRTENTLNNLSLTNNSDVSITIMVYQEVNINTYTWLSVKIGDQPNEGIADPTGYIPYDATIYNFGSDVVRFNGGDWSQDGSLSYRFASISGTCNINNPPSITTFTSSALSTGLF